MINYEEFDRKRSEYVDINFQIEGDCGICGEFEKLCYYDSDLQDGLCNDCDTHGRKAITEMRKSVTNPNYGKGKAV